MTVIAQEISETDHAVLECLTQDARMSTAELARRVGLARTTVQTKIGRLIDRGIIQGFSVRINPAAQPTEIAAIVMIRTKPGFGHAGQDQILAVNGLRRLSETCGDFGYVAEVTAPTLEVLNGRINELGNIKGIERTQSHVLLAQCLD